MKASTNSRGKEFAITIAQSKRAKSVKRSNNPSKVISIRCLRDKDGPTFGKTVRNCTSLQDGFTSMKEELRTQATRTSVNAVGNSIKARSRIFLQIKEVIKLGLINSPADVIRSMLNMSQNIFMLVMSRRLENGSPIFTKSSSRVIFIIQGAALFICNSTERQRRFLVALGTLSTPASS